jgi:hypothetical protein
MKKTSLYLAVALVLLPSLVFGQGFQNGNLAAVVKDATGAVLPGVTVTVTSEERGTQRTAVTDTTGRAAFPILALGFYTVEATLEGFQTQTRKGNRVVAEKTTEVPITLALAATTETIVVTGQQPVVDRTNVTASTQLSTKEFERAPVGRGYQAVAAFTPGVVDQPGNPSSGNPQVHGSPSTTNVFLFDGVDTTDTTTGTFGANLNFEAIQEVSVQTSGMSAEYGRAQGAVINVITKSGTNDFQGSVKIIETNDAWNAQNKTSNQVTGASLARARNDDEQYRYSATLGGPIWRDHVWFFGAYEKVDLVVPAVTTTVSQEEYTQNQALRLPVYRLTAQLTPTQSIWGLYTEDPFTGIVRDYWGASPELFSLTAQDQGGDKLTFQYSGVFGTNITAEALYGQSNSTITVAPYRVSPLHSGAPHLNLADNKFYNGATFDGMVDRPRKQVVVAGSYYATLAGNVHNFKAGVDWQNLQSTNFFRYPNSQLFIDESFDWQTRTFTPSLRLDFIDGPSTSEGDLMAFYVRDKFDIGRRFFLEAGLRFEKESQDNDVGTKVLDTDSISPRLQASYDLFGNGNTVLLGTYGRLYQSVVQNFADTYATIPQQSNYDLYAWDGAQFVFADSIRVGAANNALNVNLKPSYVDDITFGVMQQFGPTVGAGVRYIHRSWGDIIDDVQTIGEDGVSITFDNVGNANREYDGLEFTFEKRFSNRWNLLANYTYSRARGNHFGGNSDGNITSGLNNFSDQMCRTTGDTTIGDNGVIPCSEADRLLQGRPTWDIPHLVNLLGTYVFSVGPVNLTAGGSGFISSGNSFSKTRTLTVLDDDGGDSGQTRTFFYEGQGSDRGPMWWQLNGSLEATYRLFGTVDIGAKAEVFNVTDRQGEFVVSNTAWCNAETTGCQTTRNNFGTYTARGSFQAPRNFRLTWLVRF